MGDICHPHARDPEVPRSTASEEVVPQRLVELFRHAIGMGGEDGDVALLRRAIVQRDVLFDGEEELVFLMRGNGTRVLSDVLGGDSMFDHPESGHGGTRGQRRGIQ